MKAEKVALVTGAGKRRVGSVVADALAERGYAVAIHYHTSAMDAKKTVAAYKKRGVNAIAVQADLADEVAVKAMVQQTIGEFGRLDVLVNCAADYRSKRLEDVTADDVRHFFDVNTLGAFLCVQHA